MRSGVYISLTVLADRAGRMRSKPAAMARAATGAQPASIYDRAVAASLVFDPPVASFGEPLDSAERVVRAAAFVGF